MGTIVEFPDRSEVAREAAEWLIRLDGDSPPSKEELRALGAWMHRSPAHRDEIERMAALWGRMNVLTELAVPLGHTIRSPMLSWFESMLRPWHRACLLTTSFAAVVVLVAVLVSRGPATDPLLETNGQYATVVGQQNLMRLADGSQVLLNTNSQIKVDYGDEYRRVYLLQGEALFTVAKNAKRPFRVYAGNGLIEAVGTAFSVHLQGVEVDVTVTEGRVSLGSVSEPESTRETSMLPLGLLDAGQNARIRGPAAVGSSGAVAVVEKIEPLPPAELAQRLAWREGVLMFSGETLENVVKELGRYTTISIEIPDEATRRIRVGGRFPVGETEAMLTALETNFNLRVTRLSHNRVVLSPVGN